MKKFLATILLSLPLASLADMMVIRNQDNGVIALFKDACPIEHDKLKPLFLALATSKDNYVPGCWFYRDQKVFVVWFTEKGTVESEYSAQNFEYVGSDKKYL
jgi:hypothetical protein